MGNREVTLEVYAYDYCAVGNKLEIKYVIMAVNCVNNWKHKPWKS